MIVDGKVETHSQKYFTVLKGGGEGKIPGYLDTRAPGCKNRIISEHLYTHIHIGSYGAVDYQTHGNLWRMV